MWEMCLLLSMSRKSLASRCVNAKRRGGERGMKRARDPQKAKVGSEKRDVMNASSL